MTPHPPRRWGLGWPAHAVHRRRCAVSALVPLPAPGLWVGVLVPGEQVLRWTP